MGSEDQTWNWLGTHYIEQTSIEHTCLSLPLKHHHTWPEKGFCRASVPHISSVVYTGVLIFHHAPLHQCWAVLLWQPLVLWNSISLCFWLSIELHILFLTLPLNCIASTWDHAFFFKYRSFRLIFFFFILLLLYCFWLPKIGLHVLLKMVVLGKQVLCRQAEWFRVHIQLLLVFCFNSYLSWYIAGWWPCPCHLWMTLSFLGLLIRPFDSGISGLLTAR